MDIRTRWAEGAARLMAQGLGLDCETAKRKAAAELGFLPGREEPGCEEVEARLRAYQRLFCPQQGAVLRALRQEALRAMRFFSDFEPRLVGSVLSGTADGHGPITLHLFADAPEQVMLHLLNADIPYREGERSLRYRDGSIRAYPLFSLRAGGYDLDLLVLPLKALREPPAGFGEGGVMERAKLGKVERLLASMEAEEV